jgi:hypothetical protein
MRFRLIAAIAIAGASAPDAMADDAEPQPVSVRLLLGVGLGRASLGTFNDGARDYMLELEDTSAEFRFVDELGGHATFSIAPRVRLTLPHHALVETGIGLIINDGGSPIRAGNLDGEIGYRNRVIEIPLLVGIMLPVRARQQLFVAAGPTLLLAARSSWHYDLGRISSFSSGSGGGAELAVGGDLVAYGRISLSVIARYRVAITGELEVVGDRLPPVQPLQELDFSGLFLELAATLRLY